MQDVSENGLQAPQSILSLLRSVQIIETQASALMQRSDSVGLHNFQGIAEKAMLANRALRYELLSMLLPEQLLGLDSSMFEGMPDEIRAQLSDEQRAVVGQKLSELSAPAP